MELNKLSYSRNFKSYVPKVEIIIIYGFLLKLLCAMNKLIKTLYLSRIENMEHNNGVFPIEFKKFKIICKSIVHLVDLGKSLAMRICRVCLSHDLVNTFDNCFDNNGLIAREIFNLFKLPVSFFIR